MKKVCIIGGGPSGIYCAIRLLEFCPEISITIFEKDKPLLTLLPTGNGRCNLSYNETDYKEFAKNFPRGEKFLYSIFSRYDMTSTLEDFNKIGITTYAQDDNRIFPVENKSSYVRAKMLEAIEYKVNFIYKNITELPQGYDFYVLATGLKSGARIAENIGHKIVPLKPSLTGLKIKEKEFLSLEGVSLNGVIFTKIGVSGPFIYKLSSLNAYKSFPYEIKIPLLNADALKIKVKENPKKLFRNVVSEFIPKSLANILIKGNTQCANTKKSDIEVLEYLKLTAISADGKGEIVHAGGISLNEVDKNLKSKIKKNLWVIGEVLDVDGLTGGFNLQNCWSTAAIAANSIAKELTG